MSVANISLDDDLWQLGSYVLVECKNWKRHVDIPQVRNIAYISAMKGNKTALLFAANGITEDASKEILRLATTGTYIIVIRKDFHEVRLRFRKYMPQFNIYPIDFFCIWGTCREDKNRKHNQNHREPKGLFHCFSP